LYKYLDLYEEGMKKSIPNEILNLFNFINKSQITTKEQVYTYIMTELKYAGDETKTGLIRRCLNKSTDDDPRVEMMSMISNGTMDSILPYIIECQKVLKKGVTDENDLRQISKFIIFKNSVMTNVTPTEEEVLLTKKILRSIYNGKE
jgi:hypothetical protein